MDIKAQAISLAKLPLRVLWFIFRNPFLIIKRVIRWSLIAVFWLFLLGWGISAFAVESATAPTQHVGRCTGNGVTFNNSYTVSQCIARFTTYLAASPWNGINITYVQDWASSGSGSSSFKWTFSYNKVGNGSIFRNTLYLYTNGGPIAFCPPTDKPEYTIGPVDLNGSEVCQKPPITCKMGEIKAISETTGAETCQENCSSVSGQSLADAAYNKAFLPSATVTCYGSCSVISQGTTIELPSSGFAQHGDIQFTGDKCPVTFPEEGDETQPTYVDQPKSSDETAAAQDQLANAASSATSTANQVSGATGTADLNQVVDKLAETHNAQVKASSEQNAALGKVVEAVGKDIQGAIREGNSRGGSGATSVGQLQMANEQKKGNALLQNIADKLDEQQDPEPPIQPGTELEPDAKAIHEANDWGARNFTTVLQANADRYRALGIFNAPTAFFTANISGGSCPTYSGSFSLFGKSFAVSIDAFCSQAITNVLPYIRAVVMLFFAWLSWRISFGNGG